MGSTHSTTTQANHDDIILDGYTRYGICTENDIPFKTKAISLPDRAACIDWISKNALGRRNLTEDEKSYLRGKRYNAEKKQGERHDLTSGQNVQKWTATKIADDFNVDEKTIRRDAKFADRQISDSANFAIGLISGNG